jgi:integrase/recombinase XerD
VNIEHVPIDDLVRSFLEWCSRHRSPVTVRFYRTRLRLFIKAFGHRDAASVTSLEIDAYLHDAGLNVSNSTRHHNAVSLTTLQSFALRESLIEKPWFKKLEKPRMGRRERIPSAEEIAALLKGASPEFRLIYTGLLQCGARPGELCRTQISDVDWPKGRITLAEHKTARKTGKARVIPIGRNFGQTLQKAIDHRQTGPVFRSPKGEAWTVGNLSSTHRRLRDVAGLPRDLVLYLARHRFGTEALRAGVPLKDVSELMGHASVTTTEIYLHRDVTELAGGQDRLPQVWDLDDESSAMAV